MIFLIVHSYDVGYCCLVTSKVLFFLQFNNIFEAMLFKNPFINFGNTHFLNPNKKL